MNAKAIKEHSSPLSEKSPFSSLSEQLDDKKNKKTLSKNCRLKADLIKELTRNYPNFLKKDLIKLLDITINEMMSSLKEKE